MSPAIQRTLAYCLLAALLTPLPALAYIDPNTGGMIFQVMAPIVAMIASAWLFLRDKVRALWQGLRRRILGTPPREDAPPSGPDSN